MDSAASYSSDWSEKAEQRHVPGADEAEMNAAVPCVGTGAAAGRQKDWERAVV